MEINSLSSSQAQIETDSAIKNELIRNFHKVKTPGIKTEDKISEAGRIILGFHFVRMLVNEPGTRLGEDIEALHDMRVATRRMRVAFEVFDPFFKHKAIKPHIEGLRRTGRALGKVRDLDVFVDKLNDYLIGLPENERSGFEFFLFHWIEKRNKAQSKMICFLDSSKYHLFTQQFSKFLNTPGKGIRRSTIIEPDRVRDLTPIMIYERLAEVRTFEQVLGNASIEELHALRLQLKKLRYVIEFFRDVLGSESKEIIESIKILQDHLGDLNDADVACQKVNDFIAVLGKEKITLPTNKHAMLEPIMRYRATKFDDRHRLISTFPQTWQRIMENGFSEKLAKAISVM